MPYDEYLERFIAKPLGLDFFAIHQPVPERLMPNLTTGYDVSQGTPIPRPFQLIRSDYPAYSLSASAGDMARYMTMLLAHGELEGTRILSDASARAMQSVHYREDPRTRGGIGYFFFVSDVNGHRTVGHDGDMAEYATDMTLLPDDGVGFFVSVNGKPSEPRLIKKLFLDRYFPFVDRQTPATASVDVERLKRYEGLYQSSRTGFTNITIIVNLMGIRTLAVRVDTESGLVVGGESYVEVEPDVFRAEEGTNRIVFRDNLDTGRLDFVMDAPVVYFKVPWHRRPRFNTRLLLVLTAVLLTAVVGWPLGAWLRRWWQVEGDETTGLPRFVAGGAACCFVFLFLAFSATSMDINAWMQGVPGPIKVGLLLTFPAILLSLGAAYFCFRAWHGGHWSLLSRAHYTVVTVSLFVLIWFCNNWNLIGWRF
jgi:hypothetical protein